MLVKAKVHLPFCLFLTFSSVQDQEHYAQWTKHHSTHLGGGVLAFLFGALMEELGLQVPLSSEQRAQGTRHPTVPRSQTPFLK